ncbi:MAG: hypothetical protein IJ681_00455 [Bacteroidales bacterium]|nr:hypothetical protein [Bacteroidales bacterium]
MANTYKHGAYAKIGASAAQNATSTGTIAVYIGTAPVNLVQEYSTKNVVNYPKKISNLLDAQKSVGYSDDWDKFTLCEAIAAHFDNKLGNIGPVYFINVLDPAVHKKAAETSKTLNFVNGSASFISDTVILDTVSITGKTAGTDFSVDYNFTTGKVIINSLEATPLSGNVEVKFFEIDLSNIDEDTIIGGVTSSGQYSGIGALPLVYQELGKVPNLVLAPKWSENKKVYQKLCTAIQDINDQWDAFALADIPLEGEAETNIDIYSYSGDNTGTFYTAAAIAADATAYSDRLLSKVIGTITAVTTTGDNPSVTIGTGNAESLTINGTVKKTVTTTVDTIEEALAWKRTNAYDSERTKVFWPQGYDGGTERIFHGSTLGCVEFLRADDNWKNVPAETCSNKEIPVTAQYFGANATNQGFDRVGANNLNEYGISTLFSDGGKLKLWGGHTAKYQYGADDDPRCIFDTYMRMLMYCENQFQKRQGSKIDKPFNRGLRDSILTSEQKQLDALVAVGALIGEPKILFLASENSTEDLMTGDFKFDIPITVAPQYKSSTAEVLYTDAGLSSLVEEG